MRLANERGNDERKRGDRGEIAGELGRDQVQRALEASSRARGRQQRVGRPRRRQERKHRQRERYRLGHDLCPAIHVPARATS